MYMIVIGTVNFLLDNFYSNQFTPTKNIVCYKPRNIYNIKNNKRNIKISIRMNETTKILRSIVSTIFLFQRHLILVTSGGNNGFFSVS